MRISEIELSGISFKSSRESPAIRIEFATLVWIASLAFWLIRLKSFSRNFICDLYSTHLWGCQDPIPKKIKMHNKSSQINALPAASRNRQGGSEVYPEINARPRQGVTGLKRYAKMK